MRAGGAALGSLAPDEAVRYFTQALELLDQSPAADAITRIAPRISVLADRDEWVYRNYESVTRGYVALEQERAARQRRIADLEERLADAVRERGAPGTPPAVSGEPAAGQAELVRRLAAQETETARRASFRWWLALPFRRLRNALAGKPPWT